MQTSKKTKDIMALSDEFIFICIDIANGYSEHLVEYVERVRAESQTRSFLQATWLLVICVKS